MMKRLFDFCMAALFMLMLSPVFLISYLAVKLTSKGPGIFKQERIGLHGKPFMIYKFRTMIVNEEDEGIPQLAEVNDDRLTKVGAWLRSHHIDELPQLWNVLKGDMSFVGYRPERQYFINQIIAVRPDYQELYAIRPGITSLATIYNGYTYTIEKMIRRLDMDLDYLHHMSILEDLRIIFLTAINILFGKKI
jgi:lipopolysaccharide/colanic/teichoic acid biosynthesis glycosyltransferase